MAYGRYPYGGVAYAASDVDDIPAADTEVALAVEWSPTTGALDTPVWVDITGDVRRWDTTRGRTRELERFQPGRATIVLSNRERQYDSVNTAGPNYPNVKPMRRIRIRETFNGVTYPTFDGLIDRWHLDYPGVGKDAIATVTATDAFKVFARTDLPRSVYTKAVADDAPAVWFRLDETVDKLREGFALNAGSLGAAADGSFIGAPEVGGQNLIANDPGASLRIRNSQQYDGTPLQGVTLDNARFSLLSNTVFAVESWAKLEASEATSTIWSVTRSGDSIVHAICGYENGVGKDRVFAFIVLNSALSLIYGVMTSAGTAIPGAINHVVCSVESGGQMAIWLNGTRHVTAYPGSTATSLSGVTRPTNGHFAVGNEYARTGAAASINWGGELSEIAVYPSGLSSARIVDHYVAGTAPWFADQPGARMARALDIASWPAALRELDVGNVALQSAELGTPVLEHLQKVGETEFGLVFMTRDGKVRLVGRAAVLTRGPGPEVFGDGPGEAGYTAFTPDDGDEVIRNSTTISRLNGVAKTSEDTASVTAYGRFAYVLDGLLHSSDQYSADYAATITAEYKDPRRRIVSLTCGPPIAGEEDTVYPAMLGPELGDVITVVNNPLGGGAEFQQACAIEGISCAGTPGGVRTTTFALSPTIAFSEEVEMAWTAWTPTLANLTLGSGSVNAEYQRIGQTINYRFKFKLGAGSAVGTGPSFTLPVAPSSDYVSQEDNSLGVGSFLDAGTQLYPAFVRYDGSSIVSVFGYAADVTTATARQPTATVPFTWTTSDVISISGTYEAAV